MALVKRVLWPLAALVLVLLIGGMALPTDYHVERSTLVKAAPAKAFALVVEPRRWKDWTVWNRRDPAMKISYFGPDAGSGAGWQWQSASEGDGKMTLTTIAPDQQVGYELYFPDWDDTTTGALRFEPLAEGTRVTWLMDGRMSRNPLMRWMGLLMDRLIGPDFDAGLAQLKALAETP